MVWGNLVVNIVFLFIEYKKEFCRCELIKGEVMGVKSCLDDFNCLSKGYQKQDLIIVVVRLLMGKLVWMCNDVFVSMEDGIVVLMIFGEDKLINMLE